MAMSTAIPVVAGVVVILVIIRDVFHTLFHPSSRGALSSQTIRIMWGAFRAVSRRRTERLSLAGPVSLLAVIALWTIAITLGWALVLWPLLPEGFLYDSGLEPEDNAGFRDAIYLSMVTLATLGYGDITPQDTWLRILAPLEAMLGFGIITAAISWILSVNPILSRRRRLSRQVALLHENSHWASMVEAEMLRSAVMDGGER
jgi:voltage-gated potassium channel Kch